MATKKKTLEELQEMHSEMCATAADLGMQVPEDLTIDFDSAEVGSTVVSNLEALIRKFRSGINEEGDKKSLAAEDEGSDNEVIPAKKAGTTKTAKAAPKKTKTIASAEVAEANAAAAKESTVAKKAKAKKVTLAKKAGSTKAAPAKKANGIDENAKITWNAAKKNPARDGSGRFERIEQVRKASGKTVKTFLAAKGNATTLRNCVAAKLCTVG